MDESLQQEARALGDRTRHRIFRSIADAERPVDVAELTNFVQLNQNAVRRHLAILKESNLVVEEVEARVRPGRPPTPLPPSLRGVGEVGRVGGVLVIDEAARQCRASQTAASPDRTPKRASSRRRDRARPGLHRVARGGDDPARIPADQGGRGTTGGVGPRPVPVCGGGRVGSEDGLSASPRPLGGARRRDRWTGGRAIGRDGPSPRGLQVDRAASGPRSASSVKADKGKRP